MKRCPNCAEENQDEVNVCGRCGRNISPAPELPPVQDAPTENKQLRVRNVVFPKPGEVIANPARGTTYTMFDRIGEGHFGITFACTDPWENELAAKVMKPIGTYEFVRTSAAKEIARLIDLRHPHITYVFDAFEYRDTFYIITERCHGPLSDLFKLEAFNGLGWLLPVARCMLQAVHYLHGRGVAHQDIHLGNVFTAFQRDEMDPDNPGSIQFKVGDLGIAKPFDQIDAANTLAEWMKPPEAVQPEVYGPVTQKMDIYHCGLLLLQLALSKPMQFSREEILQGVPRQLALALPQPLNFAIEKALRRHAVFRTATAMELWRDLKSPPEQVQPEQPAVEQLRLPPGDPNGPEK